MVDQILHCKNLARRRSFHVLLCNKTVNRFLQKLMHCEKHTQSNRKNWIRSYEQTKRYLITNRVNFLSYVLNAFIDSQFKTD